MTNRVAPVWTLRVPETDWLGRFREEMRDVAFSYAAVGATRDDAARPAGFDVDHNRARLGSGEVVWARACAAMRAWTMFPGPWTRIAPAEAPIRVGEVVAMQAKAFGVWWVNACRIVYVIEESAAAVRRFGFAYGTLPAHVESGEERFSVEMRENGEVWYDVRAFSRPRYWPVRLAKPLARRLQRKFVEDSKRAMQEAVR